MFPPPATTTTCTPKSRTSLICRAISWTASGQMPTPWSPPRASPLSFSRIRRYLAFKTFFISLCNNGAPCRQWGADLNPNPTRNRNRNLDLFRGVARTRLGLRLRLRPRKNNPSDRRAFAYLKPRETPDDHFVTQLLGDAAQMFLDRDFRVAFDKSLVQQADALIELLQLAFDNLGHRLGRLVLNLLGGDFLLLRHRRGRNVLARNHRRIAGRDLQRDVSHQLLEFLRR